MKIHFFQTHALIIFSSVLCWPSNNNNFTQALRGGEIKNFQNIQEYSRRALRNGAKKDDRTKMPSSQSSSSPSSTPSLQPTVEESNDPTVMPSGFPSLEPSAGPSASPTESCDLTLTMECSSTLGDSCDSIPPQYTQCNGRPSRMAMRFLGGGCDQSDNAQESAENNNNVQEGAEEHFFCTDHVDGGLSTEHGTEYFIKISSHDNSVTYFADFAKVGHDITLDDGGERFESDVIVNIYSSTDSSSTTRRDPEDILGGMYEPVQVFQFQTSCAQNLFLTDIFGSLKVIGFTNDIQGSVSVFHKVSIGYTVTAENDKSLPIELDKFSGFWTQNEDGEVTTTEFNDDVIITEVNDDDFVADATIDENNLSVSGEMFIEIDLSTEKLYEVTGYIVANSTSTSQVCVGSDFVTFTAGNP